MAEAGNALIFDRAHIRRNRARAASSGHDGFLRTRIESGFSDRLSCIKRSFSEKIVLDYNFFNDDEIISCTAQSCDLILSPLVLHALNDLPGALIQIRRALKPDGLFIGALFGGETLCELRACLMEAEMNVCGGISPRVAPMAGRRDMAALMQRAGFALPVVDADTVTVMYRDIFHLMRDLRGMGETNALAARRRNFTPRRLFAEADKIYRAQHGDTDGRIAATFEIITLTGWAPHESQQKPLKRGSAERSMAEALEC